MSMWYRGLQIINDPDLNKIRVVAKELLLGTPDFLFRDVDLICDVSTNGELGLDTGVPTINTWYDLVARAKEDGSDLTLQFVLMGNTPASLQGFTEFDRVSSHRNNGVNDFYKISNAPDSNWFYYDEDIGAGDFLLLNGGTATVFTAVPGVTAIMPATCRRAEFSGDAHRIAVGEEGLNIRETGSGIPKSAGTLVLHANAKQISATFLARVDANQSFDYALQNAGTAFIRTVAYEDIR